MRTACPAYAFATARPADVCLYCGRQRKAHDPGEAETRARLHAAAPDMLAALRDVAGYLQRLGDRRPALLTDEVEAAIAKATGEEARP